MRSNEEVKSTIRAVVAEALAEALILGIDECEEHSCALTQVQRVQLAKMSVMSFDNALEACANLDAWESIEERLRGGRDSG